MVIKKVTKEKVVKHAKPEIPVVAGRYIEAVGRRKTAVARVRIFSEAVKKQEILVNGKQYRDYFPILKQQLIVAAPFKALSMEHYYVVAKVIGGGVSAQAEAVRLGISRTLVSENPESRARLKALGFLKRDPRAVERKHPGLRKARRPQQWRKR
ncbi:MAG: 30S ribosomal protein S9 [Candidatus Jorgensenbacteria bacterium]|nr:30S ribosomal protein S9 [Candidatus Jorgensenbacteria bacterium]